MSIDQKNDSPIPICEGCKHSGGFIPNNLLGVVFSTCKYSNVSCIVYDMEEGKVLLTECEHFTQED